MTARLDEEGERKKRAIFDSMSPKRRQRILEKIGYENWDPFQEPKDPIDLREQKTEQLALVLIQEFNSECGVEKRSNEYREAVKEICRGLIKGEERYKGIFDFCRWYGKKGSLPHNQ
ncbi:MAG TPA: hypothetical protein VMW89_18950 [Desulfatiglandales bacterium]|nr:hypothetical protein [Desulfatiglandales bacterium]